MRGRVSEKRHQACRQRRTFALSEVARVALVL